MTRKFSPDLEDGLSRIPHWDPVEHGQRDVGYHWLLEGHSRPSPTNQWGRGYTSCGVGQMHDCGEDVTIKKWNVQPVHSVNHTHLPNGTGGGGGMSDPSGSMTGGRGGGAGMFVAMGGAPVSTPSPLSEGGGVESNFPSTLYLNLLRASTCSWRSLSLASVVWRFLFSSCMY